MTSSELPCWSSYAICSDRRVLHERFSFRQSQQLPRRGLGGITVHRARPYHIIFAAQSHDYSSSRASSRASTAPSSFRAAADHQRTC